MIVSYCNPQPFQIINYVPQTAKPVTADEIIEAVSKAFGVSVKALQSKSRKRTLTDARAVASYLLKLKVRKISLSKIGALTGGRDHSSAIYSIHCYNDLSQTDKAFANKANTAKQLIREVAND